MFETFSFEKLGLEVTISDAFNWRASRYIFSFLQGLGRIEVFTEGLSNSKETFTIFLHEFSHFLLWRHAFDLYERLHQTRLRLLLAEFLAWILAKKLADSLGFVLEKWIIEYNLSQYTRCLSNERR